MVGGPHPVIDWLYLFSGVACFAVLLIPFYRSKGAGQILLDVSGHDSSRVGFGILMLATGLFWMVFATHYRFEGFGWLGYGALVTVANIRRLQIREAGVVSSKLFPWENIREYYLGPTGGLSLNLRDTGWKNLGSVPREQRERVNDLLSSRVPAQHVIGGF
jgi:hypothetical protein